MVEPGAWYFYACRKALSPYRSPGAGPRGPFQTRLNPLGPRHPAPEVQVASRNSIFRRLEQIP